MNKTQLLISMIFFLVFSTILAGAVTGFSTTMNPADGGTAFTLDLAGIGQVFSYFFNLLTFQVVGIPSVINLLVFWPLTIGILFLLFEQAVNFLNAVIPF